MNDLTNFNEVFRKYGANDTKNQDFTLSVKKPLDTSSLLTAKQSWITMMTTLELWKKSFDFKMNTLKRRLNFILLPLLLTLMTGHKWRKWWLWKYLVIYWVKDSAAINKFKVSWKILNECGGVLVNDTYISS